MDAARVACLGQEDGGECDEAEKVLGRCRRERGGAGGRANAVPVAPGFENVVRVAPLGREEGGSGPVEETVGLEMTACEERFFAIGAGEEVSGFCGGVGADGGEEG